MKRLTKQAQQDLLLLERVAKARPEFQNIPVAGGILVRTAAELLQDVGKHEGIARLISETSLRGLIAYLQHAFKKQFNNVTLTQLRQLMGTVHYPNVLSRIALDPCAAGLIREFNRAIVDPYLQVAFTGEDTPIGLVYLYAVHSQPIKIGWWIDRACRGLRYSYPMLDACAHACRYGGATELGEIIVKDEVEERSRRLAQYFRMHFP